MRLPLGRRSLACWITSLAAGGASLLTLPPTRVAAQGTPSPSAPRTSPPADTASSRPINPWAADSADAAALRAGGARVEAPHVVLWYPRDSLTGPQARALADSVDRGVAAMAALVGAPYAWQRLAGRRVTVWLAPHRFISHGTGRGEVFLPFPRVRDGTAPYLHEAAHELLLPTGVFREPAAPDSASLARLLAVVQDWLYEGLADAVSTDDAVRAAPGVVQTRHVFAVGTPATNDSVCAARARAPGGAAVLAAVGVTGWPSVLRVLYTAEGRTTAAPTFYACAGSFTRYLMARAGGPRAFVARIPAMQRDGLEATVRAATGEPLAAVRHAWVHRLALDSAP